MTASRPSPLHVEVPGLPAVRVPGWWVETLRTSIGLINGTCQMADPGSVHRFAAPTNRGVMRMSVLCDGQNHSLVSVSVAGVEVCVEPTEFSSAVVGGSIDTPHLDYTSLV